MAASKRNKENGESEFTKDGYWWLPSNPEKQVPGTIVYGQTLRLELRLLGSLQGEMEFLQRMGRWGDSFQPEIILGLTADGKKITLFDSMQSGGNFNFNSFMTENYLPRIVLEGRHFACADDMIFHQMTMRLSHIDEWYQKTGRTITLENMDSDARRVTMTYRSPDPLSIRYEGGYIELGFDSNIRFPQFGGDYVLSEKSCVSVYPQVPVHLLSFIDSFLPPVIHFFTLGVGRCLSLIELRGKAAADCPDGTEEQEKSAPTIRFFGTNQFYGDEDKKLFPHDMVCTYPDFQNDLERCLGVWMKSYQEIRPVMQLFFGKVLRRERNSFSSNSFLNAVQSAEAYHRYRRGGTDLEENEFQNLVDHVLEGSPEKYRDWLQNKIEHINEMSLGKRIKELLLDRSDLFEFSNTEIKRHARRITEIRNHFTHYSGEKRSDFATGLDFFIYDTLMTWTMIACLLEEMGIERSLVHRLIDRNQSFRHFRTVRLKNQQVEIMRVEAVKAEDISGLKPDNPVCPDLGSLENSTSKIEVESAEE
jgi:hypothetical protein